MPAVHKAPEYNGIREVTATVLITQTETCICSLKNGGSWQVNEAQKEKAAQRSVPRCSQRENQVFRANCCSNHVPVPIAMRRTNRWREAVSCSTTVPVLFILIRSSTVPSMSTHNPLTRHVQVVVPFTVRQNQIQNANLSNPLSMRCQLNHMSWLTRNFFPCASCVHGSKSGGR